MRSPTHRMIPIDLFQPQDLFTQARELVQAVHAREGEDQDEAVATLHVDRVQSHELFKGRGK